MGARGGEARTLLTRSNDQCPESWAPSSQGSLLAYADWDPVTGLDIWLRPEGKDPIPAVRTEWSEHSPTLSPDGRFLAYVSNRSERDQIYVQKVGSADAVLVSKDGGTEPLWSGDGHELFFRSGDRLISASITTSPELRIGNLSVLFEAAFDRASPAGHAYYDVARDGKRFLAVADSSAVEIQIVTNWFEELKRLAPATR